MMKSVTVPWATSVEAFLDFFNFFFFNVTGCICSGFLVCKEMHRRFAVNSSPGKAKISAWSMGGF